MSSIHESDVRLDHEILVLDAYLREPLNTETRQQDAKSFVQDLLRTLCMVPLGPMQFYNAVDLSEPGWSFIQPITTSHIGVHYFEAPRCLPHVRMDIYSCKRVDWRTVIEVTDSHMKFETWRATFIHRNIDTARGVQDIQGMGSSVTSIDILQDAQQSVPIVTAVTEVSTH